MEKDFQKTIQEAVALYMDYGQFGRKVISAEAEARITEEIQRLGEYTNGEMRNFDSILRAAIDPAKEVEALAYARRFHQLVLASLPSGSTKS